MLRENRYKIISATITALLVILLFVAFNIDYLPFSMYKPNLPADKGEDLELKIEDFDLTDLLPPPEAGVEKNITEKSEKKATVAEKQNSAKKSNAENENDLVSEQGEKMGKISAPNLNKIALSTTNRFMKDTVADSTIKNEIEKFIKEQKLADLRDTKRKQARERVEGYEFYRNNYRAIYNFMKIYPYAIQTREILDSMNLILSKTSNKNEQKRIIDNTEKTLFNQYEQAVRNLTVSQGQVLLKMIYRETDKTGYDLIKKYKGGFTATFWYSVGKLFKTDLKTEYDTSTSDSIYEKIIDRYENGEYKLVKRTDTNNKIRWGVEKK